MSKVKKKESEVNLNIDDFRYVEVAIDNFGNRNQVKTIDEIEQVERTGSDVPYYATTCCFNIDLLDFQKKHRSLARYPGFGIQRFIHFDFDNKNNIASARACCQQVASFLSTVHNVPAEAIRFFFSGGRGFHIILPNSLFGGFSPAKRPEEVQRLLAMRIVEQAGILTTDSSFDRTVYKKLQLFRLPNSRHQNRECFKIYLNWRQFSELPIAQIYELAHRPQPLDYPEDDDFFAIPYLQDIAGTLLLADSAKSKEQDRYVDRSEFENYFRQKPCLATMFAGRLSDYRKRSAFVLASKMLGYYEEKGMNQQESRENMESQIRAWNETNIPPLPEIVLNNSIKSAKAQYDYGCHHEYISPFCKRDHCTWARLLGRRRGPRWAGNQRRIMNVLTKIPHDHWTEDELWLLAAIQTELRNSRPDEKNIVKFDPPKGLPRRLVDEFKEKHLNKAPDVSRNSKEFVWRK